MSGRRQEAGGRRQEEGGGERRQQKRARSNPFRAAAVAVAIALHTLRHLVWHAIVLRGARSAQQRQTLSNRQVHRWAAGVCRLMGIRVRAVGTLPTAGSLIAPNHLGYMDILAMASVAPFVFVSKAEVLQWPLIGFLARRAEQLSVSRRRSKDLLDAIQRAAERLRSGQTVCVFLEGTSTGGAATGRFLPPFLQAAVESQAPVVPVAIVWRSSRPGCDVSEDLAYWKDHSFPSHLWRLLGLKGFSASIRFGERLEVQGAGRKEVASRLRRRVEEARETAADHGCRDS